MIKKLILVGCTTQNNTFVNGQSMMFQLFVDKLKEKNVSITIVDFGNSIERDFGSKRVSGQFNYIKLVDNFLLVLRFIYVVLSNLGTPIYITTSQTKVGFIRDFIFINIGKFLGSKIIAHQFGSNYDKFYEKQSSTLKKKIISTFEKTEKIIVEGDYTKNHFKFLKNYSEKVISIPNGLPENIENQKNNAKRIDKQKPIKIIYLSNLIEGKGYWDVLHAFDILVNRNRRDVEAVFSGKFLGDVDDKIFKTPEKAREAFFRFIDEKNLSKKIQYFEGLFGENKARAFQEAHFFLLPSYYINEGQPVSVLEALAYGCVPIVTEYRLIPDMVNKKNGIFVNRKSPEEIANAINTMIENPEQYTKLSQNGIDYFKNNFTADEYIAKLMKLF